MCPHFAPLGLEIILKIVSLVKEDLASVHGRFHGPSDLLGTRCLQMPHRPGGTRRRRVRPRSGAQAPCISTRMCLDFSCVSESAVSLISARLAPRVCTEGVCCRGHTPVVSTPDACNAHHCSTNGISTASEKRPRTQAADGWSSISEINGRASAGAAAENDSPCAVAAGPSAGRSGLLPPFTRSRLEGKNTPAAVPTNCQTAAFHPNTYKSQVLSIFINTLFSSKALEESHEAPSKDVEPRPGERGSWAMSRAVAVSGPRACTVVPNRDTYPHYRPMPPPPRRCRPPTPPRCAGCARPRVGAERRSSRSCGMGVLALGA